MSTPLRMTLLLVVAIALGGVFKARSSSRPSARLLGGEDESTRCSSLRGTELPEVLFREASRTRIEPKVSIDQAVLDRDVGILLRDRNAGSWYTLRDARLEAVPELSRARLAVVSDANAHFIAADGTLVRGDGAKSGIRPNLLRDPGMGSDEWLISRSVVFGDTIVWSLSGGDDDASIRRSNGPDIHLEEASGYGLAVLNAELAAVWQIRAPFTLSLFNSAGVHVASVRPDLLGPAVQGDGIGLVAVSAWAIGCGMIGQFVSDLRGTRRWLAVGSIRAGRLLLSDFPPASGIVGFDDQRFQFVTLQDTGKGVDIVRFDIQFARTEEGK